MVTYTMNMLITLFERKCLFLIFTLTSDNLSLYITLLLYWSLYNCAAHAADILTATTVV